MLWSIRPRDGQWDKYTYTAFFSSFFIFFSVTLHMSPIALARLKYVRTETRARYTQNNVHTFVHISFHRWYYCFQVDIIHGTVWVTRWFTQRNGKKVLRVNIDRLYWVWCVRLCACLPACVRACVCGYERPRVREGGASGTATIVNTKRIKNQSNTICFFPVVRPY